VSQVEAWLVVLGGLVLVVLIWLLLDWWEGHDD